MATWFEGLFGRPEVDVHRWFRVVGDELLAPNGRRFGVGRFDTPRLGALRAQGQRMGRRGRTTVSHEVIGDVLELHAQPENAGAMFQVASQFNCLEFPSPHTLPEHGVTDYASDYTQGPACSLAAAAATVYRNWWVPMMGGTGQSAARQLDLTADLSVALGPAAFFTVRNGYTDSDPERLAALAEALEAYDREALLDRLRIGVQSQVEVTFADRFTPPAQPTHVSQAFCSAVSCGYVGGVSKSAWAPLATMVLDAAYEATLWAAIVDAASGRGSGRVWLTFVGGGVFGNDPAWIRGAMQRALARVDGFELEVLVAHYGGLDPRYQ